MGLYANQMLIEFVRRMSERVKLKKEIKKEAQREKREEQYKTGGVHVRDRLCENVSERGRH